MSTEKQPEALRRKGRRMLSEATEEAWANEPNASDERIMSIFAATAAELLDGAIEHIEKLEAQIDVLRADYDAARLEIESLKAQLEAVGAGRVQQLQQSAQAISLLTSTAPDSIFLDVGEDCPADVEFASLNGEVTWSEDDAMGNGIEYVRKDLASLPVQSLQHSAPEPLTDEKIDAAILRAWDEMPLLTDRRAMLVIFARRVLALLGAQRITDKAQGADYFKKRWMQIADQRALEVAALEVEVARLRAAQVAYAREFAPGADGEPDTGSIHRNIRALKAQLEAARTVAATGEYPPLPEPDATTVGLGMVWNRHSMRAYADAVVSSTKQSAPVPLTDDQIDAITAAQWGVHANWLAAVYRAYARAILKAADAR